MSQSQNSGVLVAGLALFSMFFGAGDLIWPLILGGSSGDQNGFAMLGLLITGVSLPLLGLISMMLFEGNYHAFFERVGKIPSLCLIFIIQAILGPLGSIPRLITLSYATLRPYLPEQLTLFGFSIAAACVILAFTLKSRRVITILGLILTPILLISLCAILLIGFWSHPDPVSFSLEPYDSFKSGIKVGYNTLDLIASFIFAPLVLSHFIKNGSDTSSSQGRREVFKKMVKASLLAAGLLSIMYIGLTYLASFYTHVLPPHQPEERLSAIARLLLGHYGALISCLSVSLACLTTAIPLVSICANYIREDLLKNRSGPLLTQFITLAISILIANLGFMGIAGMLSPILQILCPGLIVLSLLNVIHKLYERRISRVPVLATFALSTLESIF